eukprot:COSAG06_NODE_43_length_29826_cov_32.009621_30_plen_682_part_01
MGTLTRLESAHHALLIIVAAVGCIVARCEALTDVRDRAFLVKLLQQNSALTAATGSYESCRTKDTEQPAEAFGGAQRPGIVGTLVGNVWNISTDPCEPGMTWAGVVCTYSGSDARVAKLGLSFCNIDVMPDSIGDLDKLNYLDIRHNNLKRLPESISKLTMIWNNGNLRGGRYGNGEQLDCGDWNGPESVSADQSCLNYCDSNMPSVLGGAYAIPVGSFERCPVCQSRAPANPDGDRFEGIASSETDCTSCGEWQCGWGIFMSGNEWEAGWAYPRLTDATPCLYGFFQSQDGQCIRCEAQSTASFFLAALMILVVTMGFFAFVWRMSAPNRVASNLDRALEVRGTANDVLDASKHASSYLKMVGVHFQMCATSLSIQVQWPAMLVTFAAYFRGLSFASPFDISPYPCWPLYDPPAGVCVVESPKDSQANNEVLFPVFMIMVFSAVMLLVLALATQGRCLCCARRSRDTLATKDQEGSDVEAEVDADAQDTSKATIAQLAHRKSFGWALYTILGPGLLYQILVALRPPMFKGWHDGPSMVAAIIFPSPVVLIVPGSALYSMWRAWQSGRVHSPEFVHSYGWLCGQYVGHMFWWDIFLLEMRFAATICSMKLAPAAAAVLSPIVTLTVLALQVKCKPFIETKTEAAHWSSPNKMATLSYVCQIVVTVAALISSATGDERSGLST